MSTTDAGKTCIDSEQCESACIDPAYSSIGTKVVGEYYYSSFVDCVAKIEDRW